MASISSQAIRARIKIGNNIDEKTPNVVSFNVRKARGQMSATFTASLKIPQSKFSISSLGSLKNASVIIEAGPKGALKTILKWEPNCQIAFRSTPVLTSSENIFGSAI